MNVLLTGASSFTGFWFARALVAAGHRVIAPLRGRVDGYEGVRGERARRLAGLVTVIEGCPFGGEAFLSLVRGDAWDLFAHHGAATANYRSADFGVVGALAENTSGLSALLRSFQEAGGGGVLLTGSVFEQDEGVGNAPMAAFSPYGLSKGLTAQAFRYWCGTLDVPLGKFVIPNPFGPFEEPRFCHYLIRSWLRGEHPPCVPPVMCAVISMSTSWRNSMPASPIKSSKAAVC